MAGEGADQRFSDLGFIPDKYCLACSVMSMLGRVFPQAIMFHLTSSWNSKTMLEDDQGTVVTVCLTLDVGEASSRLVLQGSRGLFCPASSGKVSYNRTEIGNNFIVKEIERRGVTRAVRGDNNQR